MCFSYFNRANHPRDRENTDGGLHTDPSERKNTEDELLTDPRERENADDGLRTDPRVGENTDDRLLTEIQNPCGRQLFSIQGSFFFYSVMIEQMKLSPTRN